MRKSTFLFLLLPLLLAVGCRGSLNLAETLPKVQFKGVRLTRFPADASQEKMEIRLGLRFNYVNPFVSKALPIPNHAINFTVNGQDLPGAPGQQQGFSVPASSEKLVTYFFTFNLDSLGDLGQQGLNILGKDNVYEFSSNFKLNLLDYADEIFGVSVGNLGSDPTSPLSPYRQQLENYELKLGFGDTLRLPALPQVRPAQNPIKVQFLGQVNTLNLGGVKGSMAPMMGLMDQGFDQDAQADPFVNMLTQKVNIPIVGEKVLADYVITLAQGTFPQAAIYWQNLKDKMLPPENTPMMVHLIQQFLPNANVDANQAWGNLQQGWTTLQGLPDQLEYPGANTQGLVIEIPFVFKNRNEFAITPPQLFSHASLGGNHPIDFEAAPTNGEEAIPGGAEREMHIRLTLNWQDLANGFSGLFAGETLRPNLSGSTVLDMGYGPMPLQLDLSDVPMQTGAE